MRKDVVITFILMGGSGLPLLIEVQSIIYFGEDYIIRFKDIYGR